MVSTTVRPPRFLNVGDSWWNISPIPDVIEYHAAPCKPKPYTIHELLDADDDFSRQVLELYTLSFACPAEPPERHIAKLMRCHFYRVFVMINEEDVVIACAFVLELFKSGVCHVDYFCVRPGLRGNGVGTKFFQSLAEHIRQENRFSFLTLESETRLIPYYLKQACVDLHVQSDYYEDLKWFLLVKPLSCDFTPDLVVDGALLSSHTLCDVLNGVIVELKNVLADAALGD